MQEREAKPSPRQLLNPSMVGHQLEPRGGPQKSQLTVKGMGFPEKRYSFALGVRQVLFPLCETGTTTVAQGMVLIGQ